jgi:hypothetical protein
MPLAYNFQNHPPIRSKSWFQKNVGIDMLTNKKQGNDIIGAFKIRRSILKPNPSSKSYSGLNLSYVSKKPIPFPDTYFFLMYAEMFI